MSPKVSIIILNWNGWKDTIECLESLFKIEIYPNKEIIIVDNGSIDNSTQKLKKEFPQCVYICNKKNLGFAAGNNLGIKYALKNGADYIFLLNNDTIFIEPILEKMVNFMEDNKKIGILAPKLLLKNGKTQESARPLTTPLGFIFDLFGLRNFFSQYSFNKTQEVGYVAGAAFLIKTEVIKKIGLLDERFFFYAEDRDWCFRANQNGWQVFYFPKAKIIHLGGRSSGIRMLLQQYRANFQFFQKYYSPYYSVILKPIISLTSMGRAMLGFLEYIFTKRQDRKIYAKEFLKLSINIWKI